MERLQHLNQRVRNGHHYAQVEIRSNLHRVPSPWIRGCVWEGLRRRQIPIAHRFSGVHSFNHNRCQERSNSYQTNVTRSRRTLHRGPPGRTNTNSRKVATDSKPSKKSFWTDSTVVLAWIASPPNRGFLIYQKWSWLCRCKWGETGKNRYQNPLRCQAFQAHFVFNSQHSVFNCVPTKVCVYSFPRHIFVANTARDQYDSLEFDIRKSLRVPIRSNRSRTEFIFITIMTQFLLKFSYKRAFL